MKSVVKGIISKAGYEVKRVTKQDNITDTEPSEYSAAEGGGTEVPCQKETYFYILNTFVREGDSVLDVGMGAGYGMNLLSIKAREVTGIDVDKKSYEHCKATVLGKNPKVKTIKLYDGSKLPFQDNTFDVISCVDVIEHVKDYDKFIDELLRVTKRVVVFGTPNRRPEYTNPDGTPTNHWHLREWSFEEFDEIAKRHTKNVKWTFIDGPWEGPFELKKRVNKNTLVLVPALIKNNS